ALCLHRGHSGDHQAGDGARGHDHARPRNLCRDRSDLFCHLPPAAGRRPGDREKIQHRWLRAGVRRTKMALLEVKNLVKSYGDRTVLDGVSFDLEEGEANVIMGPSGCGKSTLLRCLNRLIEPTSGAILFDGEDVTRPGVDVRALR